MLQSIIKHSVFLPSKDLNRQAMFGPHFLTSDSVTTTFVQKSQLLALISVSGLQLRPVARLADCLREL